MAKIKLSDYVAKRLKETYNVDTVFLVTGGGAMHLNDSLCKYIPYVCNHHEQACAFAAEGYARLNQKLVVVNPTTGPGGINCLNGVFGQWTDSVPVLYISGQVKYATTVSSVPNLPIRQLGDQEADIVNIVKPITKYAKIVNNPNEIKYHLDRAIFEATNGRYGPVWLDIPVDVQSALIDEEKLLDFIPSTPAKPDLKISDVLLKIQQAKRPIIIAGHGIRLAKQQENFKKLLKKLNIPVLTTLGGFDLIEDNHPNYIGRIGSIGQRAGNFALQNADLILCLGTRNNIRQISYNYENFAKKAFKIVVDVDLSELNKPTISPDLKIYASLNDFLPALEQNAETISRTDWLEWCLLRKEKYSFKNVKLTEYKENGTEIDPYNFVYNLSNLMQDGDVVVTANGTASVCTFQSFVIKENQRVIINSGNASMGYGLPASIGLCIANNKQNTVCITGDGSIMMNLQELQTIKTNKLPIKIFIINNNGYVSIMQTQDNFFEGRRFGSTPVSGVEVPDFIKLATAFDIKSVRIDNNSTMNDKIKEILTANEPIVCEVMVKDHIFHPKLASRKLDDGTMVSPSLEDMFPFMDRDEFNKNIID